MINLGKKHIGIGGDILIGAKSISVGGGIGLVKDGLDTPIGVSEMVTTFGFSLDFTPMFREMVTTFGWEETP
jgi:hypothetical protein